jgi:Rps23 Pro-64 3,4-dihydroxylase Tpa1-like proline 4-hydroxylase
MTDYSEPAMATVSHGVPLILDGLHAEATPFRHAVTASAIDTSFAGELLAWLEESAPWKHVRADFYEQFEFCLWDVAHPVAHELTSATTIGYLKAAFEDLFGYCFAPEVNVVAHKLIEGHRIGIHNDHLAGEETHRLVIQVNRGLSDADGGLLMLFNSGNADDVHRVLRPVHKSALAFEISGRSFHAVSRMHASERYTIVFSLRAIAI